MKKYFLITLLVTLFAWTGIAYASDVSKFQIQSSYLVSGKLNVPNSNNTTPFKVDVTITRGYGATGLQKVDHTITVMYSPSGAPGSSNDIAISTPFRVTEANFTTFASAIFDKTLDATLPANKTVGNIYLKSVFYLFANDGTKPPQPNTVNTYVTYGLNIPTSTTNPPTNTTDYPKIATLGFSTSGIKSYSNVYLVENDVYINKASLALANPVFTVNNTYSHNINIKVEQSVWSNSNWYNGLLEGTRMWNTANSDIKINLIFDSFVYDVSPRYDIVMRESSLTVPTEAEFPKGDGKPGSYIYINTASNYISPSGDDILNVFHAIAHTLGIVHTPASVPNYQNSIMAGVYANVSAWEDMVGNYGLPFAYDVNTINSKYPVNSSSTITSYINGPASFNSTASVTFRSSYISSEAGINYHWKVVGINGTTYNYEPSENNVALYDFSLPKGNYQLQCTISGGKYTTPATASKNIVVL